MEERYQYMNLGFLHKMQGNIQKHEEKIDQNNFINYQHFFTIVRDNAYI